MTRHKIPSPTCFDVAESLETVWAALAGFREDSLSEGEPANDSQWEDICTAMAWITETTGEPAPDSFVAFTVARVGEWRGKDCAPIGWRPSLINPPDSIFWTVYAVRGDGMTQAVSDLTTRGAAVLMAERLALGRPVTVEDSPLPPFRVTWESVTQESAEHGEAESCGFLDCHGDAVELERAKGDSRFDLTLRQAVEAVTGAYGTRADLQAIEASDSDMGAARWVTFYYGPDDSAARASHNYSIHFPETMTAASRVRLISLLKG